MSFDECLSNELRAERDEIDKIKWEDSDEWFRRWNRWFRKCMEHFRGSTPKLEEPSDG